MTIVYMPLEAAGPGEAPGACGQIKVWITETEETLLLWIKNHASFLGIACNVHIGLDLCLLKFNYIY